MNLPRTPLAWAALALRTRGLRQVVSALEAAGVPSIPVKGVLLAPQLYPDLADRPLSDVDLLVRPRDFRRTLAVAKAKAWRLVWDSKQLGNANFVVGDLAVDVACTIGPPGVSATGVAELLDQATRTVAPLGFPHFQLEWHHHALVMAVDAFKDKLGSKPASREDLRRMGSDPRFVPERMLAVAGAARLETMLAVVADWVLEVGLLAPWAEVRARLGGRRLRRQYASRFRELVAQPHGRRLAILARAASDDPIRRVVALALGAAGTLAFTVRNRGFSVSVDRGPSEVPQAGAGSQNP